MNAVLDSEVEDGRKVVPKLVKLWEDVVPYRVEALPPAAEELCVSTVDERMDVVETLCEVEVTTLVALEGPKVLRLLRELEAPALDKDDVDAGFEDVTICEGCRDVSEVIDNPVDEATDEIVLDVEDGLDDTAELLEIPELVDLLLPEEGIDGLDEGLTWTEDDGGTWTAVLLLDDLMELVWRAVGELDVGRLLVDDGDP